MHQFPKNFPPVFTIFPHQVCSRKIVSFLYSPFYIIRIQQRIVGCIEYGKGGFGSRKIFEVEFPVVERSNCAWCGYPDCTMRPVEVSFRVNHPPFSIDFFHVELTCGLLFRTVGPASVLITSSRAWVSLQVGSFGFDGLFHLLNRFGFPRPIFVYKLTEFVNKREKLIGWKLHPGRKRFRDSFNGSHFFDPPIPVLSWIVDVESQSRHLLGIKIVHQTL